MKTTSELERMQVLAGLKPKTVTQLRIEKVLRKLRFYKWSIIHFVVAYSLWSCVYFYSTILKNKKKERFWFNSFQHWCFYHKIPENAK